MNKLTNIIKIKFGTLHSRTTDVLLLQRKCSYLIQSFYINYECLMVLRTHLLTKTFAVRIYDIRYYSLNTTSIAHYSNIKQEILKINYDTY